VKLADLNLEAFRRDAGGILPEQDITILVLSAVIGRLRSNKAPYSEVAQKLGLTEGRVRHRTFRSIKLLPLHPSLVPYVEAFEELLAKKFSMFSPI